MLQSMLPIFKDDPGLKDHESHIMQRISGYRGWKKELEEKEGGLLHFAEGYETYGFHRIDSAKKWTFTEWLPEVKQAFLVGDFNRWENTTPLSHAGFGRWTVDLPDRPDGSWFIPHKSKLRIRIEGHAGNWFDRVPAWTKLALQDHTTNLFNGVFWEPPNNERHVFQNERPYKPPNLKVYEAHVGMGGLEPRVHTYAEFKDILPRIKRLGYNAVQLMAIAEHAHYGSFGYHVTSFFAPSSRCGTPEELKDMIDTAHGLGIIVLMDLVHAHCSSNQIDGIAAMDGTDHCYTHGGAKGKQEQWDSSLFHYTKWEVLRFLLSNIRWWLEEFGFDGFRFDGVTSMLYHSHGIGKGYSGGYHEYFGMDADVESHIYLMLANDLIHRLLPKSGITIAEDVSGMPTLCRPVRDGGFGFDYRLAMAIPDMFIKLLKECSDHDWNIGHIAHTLQNRRWKEPCIAYVESHDQAIVGDKTNAFWLMDAEMYTHMSTMSPPSMVIDRGLALHKMLRLVTLGLGGEGYLNFMGNEFGHPEWVDFPTELNGWSYQHCRRRFDMADMDHLKYKFFQAFDEVMQACEDRFKFLAATHQFCSLKNEGDKVLVFERGDCLFVFNFHPCNSYTDYRVGHPWNEPVKVVLDSDEGRFGGFTRLEQGHTHGYPPGEAWDNRYHSCSLYLPCRTAQVLVRESLLQGDINIRLEDRGWKFPLSELRVAVLGEDDQVGPPLVFDGEGGYATNLRACCTKLRIWRELGSDSNAFGPFVYTAHFPGDYLISSLGSVSCLGGPGSSLPDRGDRAPPGCSEFPDLPPRGKASLTIRSLTPTLLFPSEMPEEVQAASRNLPDYINVRTAPAAAPITKGQDLDQDTQTVSSQPESCGPSGAQTPLEAKNLPSDMISDTNSESSVAGMNHRVFSLSALEHLIVDPVQKLELRAAMDGAASEGNRPKYAARHLQTPIVVVSSEVNPWSKTGGLAMVASAYGYEFAMRGHRTMVISPRYGDYENMECVGSSKVWIDGREHEVRYWHQVQDYGQGRSADYIFVDHISYRREAGIYGNPKENREYGDNLFRFGLLCLAAMEAPLILKLQGSCYGQDVLFIANDWQAALVPVYLTYKYRCNNTYRNARCIYAIHNMGYQGKYQLSKFPVNSFLGLPREAEQDLQGEDLNLGLDCLNLMSAAIKLADRVLTVSPNYALEIQSPEGGQGLHEILRAKGGHLRLGGILNGISDEWNPATDPHIALHFSALDFQEGKAACKRSLQEKLGLHQDPNVALIGFCGRLCYQKGLHLISAVIPWLMHDDGGGVMGRVQLVLMGKGDPEYASQLAASESNYKGRICGYVGFEPRIEHQMMAGCDFLLMPSQYEPCGLPQMYAQAYATLPIVHETGGLKDSVKGLWDEGRDRDSATGFPFVGFDENHLKERLYQALEVFHRKKDLMLQMQRNALAANYYWPQALDKYEEHIDWTMEGQAAR